MQTTNHTATVSKKKVQSPVAMVTYKNSTHEATETN